MPEVLKPDTTPRDCHFEAVMFLMSVSEVPTPALLCLMPNAVLINPPMLDVGVVRHDLDVSVALPGA